MWRSISLVTYFRVSITLCYSSCLWHRDLNDCLCTFKRLINSKLTRQVLAPLRQTWFTFLPQNWSQTPAGYQSCNKGGHECNLFSEFKQVRIVSCLQLFEAGSVLTFQNMTLKLTHLLSPGTGGPWQVPGN